MREPLKQEIRRILLGYIDYDEEEHLIAAERTERLRLLGLLNGTGAAGLFGVAVRKRRYAVTDGNADIETDCRTAFANMGRSVALDTEPALTAVFYSPLLYNPSILTAAYSDRMLEVCVYTARTLTVRWNASHAFRKWRKNMPDTLREKSVDDRKNRKNRRKSRKRQEEKNTAEAESNEIGGGA